MRFYVFGSGEFGFRHNRPIIEKQKCFSELPLEEKKINAELDLKKKSLEKAKSSRERKERQRPARRGEGLFSLSGRAIVTGAPVETTLRWARTSVELQEGAGGARPASERPALAS